MNVDAISLELNDYQSSSPQVAVDPSNYLYSVKIVRAENIPPLDKNGLSDPYIVLEIDSKVIFRTRTVYETLNPRWDQAFDICLQNKIVKVLALVYDEDLFGADEECCGGWFELDSNVYSDFQIHEKEINLKPQGKLVVRIGMEGERDNIQFWFGKALRMLKRAESDAATLIIDRVGSLIIN